MTNLEFAEGLRELAEIYEKNPDAPQPLERIWVLTYSKEDFLKALKAFNLPAEKRYNEHDMELHPKTKLDVVITVPRSEVCTKRVVGTRHVKSQYIPEHEEDIVEWDCHSILDETVKEEEAENVPTQG